MRWLGEGSRRSGSETRDQAMMWYRCNMVIWPQSEVILAPYFCFRLVWCQLIFPFSTTEKNWALDTQMYKGLKKYTCTCCHLDISIQQWQCDPRLHVRVFVLRVMRLHFRFILNVITSAGDKWGSVWYMIGCDDGVIKTRQEDAMSGSSHVSEPTNHKYSNDVRPGMMKNTGFNSHTQSSQLCFY